MPSATVHQCGFGKNRKKIIVKEGTLSKLAWILETLEELIYVRSALTRPVWRSTDKMIMNKLDCCILSAASLCVNV